MSKSIIIGISGGTGSGKTSVANCILDDLKKYSSDTVLIEQDSYYKQSNKPFEERIKENYDHPNIVDFQLLISHLKKLLNGESIDKPIYNFKQYNRENYTERIDSKKIIIVEGILIFSNEELRNLFDMKIFVDTDDDIRLLRRIERDINERGRTLISIRDQYIKTVKPMYLQFVEPSKRYADVIIPNGKDNSIGIKMVSTRLKYLLETTK